MNRRMRRALPKIIRRLQKQKDKIGMRAVINAIEVIKQNGEVEVVYRRGDDN
jgi:hypothetical protein